VLKWEVEFQSQTGFPGYLAIDRLAADIEDRQVSIPDGLPRLFSRWNAPEATREEYLFQSQTGFPGYLAGQNCGASHRVSQFQSQTGFPGYLADKRAKQNVIE